MKLSHIATSNVAGVRDLDVDLMSSAGKPHDIVVVTGPEASGKTRLLDLLVAGLETIGPFEGIVRGSDWVRAQKPAAHLELGLWLDETERQRLEGAGGGRRVVVAFGPDDVVCDAGRDLTKLASHYTHDPKYGKREYFPENRQRASGGRQDGTGALEQSLWRSSKDPDKYSFVPAFLTELARDPARRRVFESGLSALAPNIVFAPGEAPDAATAIIRLANTPLFATRHGGQLRLSDLSSSEANSVIIAATAAMIGLCHSIVLLDRPELHVEPKRLVSWVHALQSLGQDNQWIVATSSRHLANAMSPSQVIRTEAEVGT